MPRAADQHLQERILQAAHRLWRTHGEKGLTLRGVAEQAGTTTTTVYKRFRNREALRRAIAKRVEERLVKTVTSCSSLEEFVHQYLRFAETHPQEYRLLYGSAWPEIFGKGRPRPIQTWALNQLAARFGGQPTDYVQANFALFLATHGAASLITAAPKNPANVEARESCLAIVEVLLKHVGIFGTRKRLLRAKADSSSAANQPD
jgi:AcrR family transcriptional regulator